MRMRLSFLFTSFLLLLVAVKLVDAQSSSFGWSFAQNIGTSLPECGTLPITITSNGASGATYYMIALAINGVPTTRLVGTAGAGLSWVVNQPAGTSVVLYLVDGSGNSGAIPPTVYTVTGGQSSQCLPTVSSSPFTIAANATNQIATCDLWQLVVRGGTPPYTVLLTSPGASSVTNVTLPAGSDMYAYINRAAPKGTLLGAVSDSKGAWTKGTPYVITTGSNDTTCGGLTSFDGVVPPDTTSTTSSTNAPTGTPSSKSSGISKTPVIAGICGSVGGLLILGAVLFCLLRRRRRNANAKKEYLEPRQFQETGNRIPAALPSSLILNRPSGFIKPGSTGPSMRRAPLTATYLPSSYEPPSTPPVSASASTAVPVPPTAVSGHDTKARESSAAAVLPQSPPKSRPVVPVLSPMRSEDSRWPPGLDQTSPEPSEAVFQHIDARAVTVRELPPPYDSQVFEPDPTEHGSSR